MDQKVFELEMAKAAALSHAGDSQEYWAGYQRGLRRRYHGEKFGEQGEHEIWLSATGDEIRELRTAGYRAGYFINIPYLSIKDTSACLGLSERAVRGLAPTVPGSFRNSSGWQIPLAALAGPPLKPGSRPKPGRKKE